MYLNTFIFPDENDEFAFFMSIKRTCYDSYYPFQILTKHQLRRLDFEPVTILYGGNGSGKSTALNVIAEKIKLSRVSKFNRSNFYQDYLNCCEAENEEEIPPASQIITSDDVFDFMLNIRHLNEGIDLKRDQLFEEYLEVKHSEFKFRSMEDYETLRRVNKSRSKTQSKFVRSELMDNIRTYSNGESAFRYFVENMKTQGLYILDEPENSLSPQKQLELVAFIEEAVRYQNCQVILSTHSPFMLALKGAKIYDLDENPVDVKRWTELDSVKLYFNFFKKHQDEFY